MEECAGLDMAKTGANGADGSAHLAEVGSSASNVDGRCRDNDDTMTVCTRVYSLEVY